jgi:acetylornithine deacetylase/succinyl-diaminopimelate desuccinylase-like protein
MRLVPNQKPEKIAALVEKHLKKTCPPGVRLEIATGHGGEPYLVAPTSSLAKAALRSLKSAFQAEPILLREGGSIPIVNDFRRILKADTLLLGLALPDDNPHSPNEKFDLDAFSKGMALGALLWPELSSNVGR